jgi:hypothetical protein
VWTKKKNIEEKYQRERDETLEKYEIEWKKRISDYAVEQKKLVLYNERRKEEELRNQNFFKN